MKDDLSRPYEQWSSAGRAVRRRRPRPAAPVLLWVGLLTLVGADFWVLLSGLLKPLWAPPSATALLSALPLGLLGSWWMLRAQRRSPPGRVGLAAGLCAMLPLLALPFTPLLLAVNQVADSGAPTTLDFTVTARRIVHGRGPHLELTLSDAAGQRHTQRLPPDGFNALQPGDFVRVQLGPGALGLPHVLRIERRPPH